MATITAHYNITDPVPFHDVDAHRDNRLYLDPHAIRLSAGPQPYVRAAVRCLDTFFERVSLDAMSSSAGNRRRGLDLLQHFEEPWETRLGMATSGFSGHGGATDVGEWIWSGLTTDLDALLRVGVLKHLEELPLFINGVDRDITSDITTRLVFSALADFTFMMLQQFPEFTAGTHKTAILERQVWNPAAQRWDRVPVELPLVDGKPLLLIPNGWARHTLLMSAGRFYETKVLSFAQDEQAVVTTDGDVLTTPKDRLREQAELARSRRTNQVVTLRAEAAGVDLLAVFRKFVDDKASRLAA